MVSVEALESVDNPIDFYRPQTKFVKVMFLQVSVCPQGPCSMVAPGGPL